MTKPQVSPSLIDACTTLDDVAHEHFDRVVSSARLPARDGRIATPQTPLSDTVAARLWLRGITDLWEHQASAIDALRAGRNVVVATGTASGKSLCYQVPIVESVVEGAHDTALLVFPTKALAQDQLAELHSPPAPPAVHPFWPAWRWFLPAP